MNLACQSIRAMALFCFLAEATQTGLRIDENYADEYHDGICRMYLATDSCRVTVRVYQDPTRNEAAFSASDEASDQGGNNIDIEFFGCLFPEFLETLNKALTLGGHPTFAQLVANTDREERAA